MSNTVQISLYDRMLEHLADQDAVINGLRLLDLSVLQESPGLLVLTAPDKKIDWAQKRYLNLLRSVAEIVSGRRVEVSLLSSSGAKPRDNDGWGSSTDTSGWEPTIPTNRGRRSGRKGTVYLPSGELALLSVETASVPLGFARRGTIALDNRYKGEIHVTDMYGQYASSLALRGRHWRMMPSLDVVQRHRPGDEDEWFDGETSLTELGWLMNEKAPVGDDFDELLECIADLVDVSLLARLDKGDGDRRLIFAHGVLERAEYYVAEVDRWLPAREAVELRKGLKATNPSFQPPADDSKPKAGTGSRATVRFRHDREYRRSQSTNGERTVVPMKLVRYFSDATLRMMYFARSKNTDTGNDRRKSWYISEPVVRTLGHLGSRKDQAYESIKRAVEELAERDSDYQSSDTSRVHSQNGLPIVQLFLKPEEERHGELSLPGAICERRQRPRPDEMFGRPLPAPVVSAAETNFISGIEQALSDAEGVSGEERVQRLTAHASARNGPGSSSR